MFFFFNDTATTEIYTLSLHDALPILSARGERSLERQPQQWVVPLLGPDHRPGATLLHHHGGRGASTAVPECRSGATCWTPDRKSTRLNSSHANISYAVFCLKKKK